MKDKSIVFTGGGTLGHVYPMIPIIKEIKKRYPNIKINFIGSNKGFERKLIEGINEIDEKEYLNVIGIKRSISLKNLKAVYLVYKNFYYLKRKFKQNKPNLIIGFGGYVEGSVMKAGLNLKIKTIIHEQNSVLGLANKLLVSKVDKVLLTFPLNNIKGIVVGNPRITDFFERRKETYYYEKDKSVLVFGGSTGAKKINDIIINLKDEFIKHSLIITLITGRKYYNDNISMIKEKACENLIIKAFEDDMYKAISENSIIVSRAGSTTIAEVMALQKVCLFIPSPNVTNNHQVKNALYYVKNNSALMIEEKDMNEKKILDNIINLSNNLFLRDEIKNSIQKNVLYDSKDKFMKEVEEIWKLMK